jgi:hypothetical protein
MKRIFALVIGSALAGWAAWLLACGPFTVDLQPVLESSPADTRAYATGELGVVRPQFALRYLLQAYRTLTPGASNRDATAASVRADPNPEPDPVSRWAQTIRALLGSANAQGQPATVEQSRHVPGSQYQTFLNCPDEAFASALRTLKARSERFGTDSAAVRDWARAQAAVFENCPDGPPVLPPPAADADETTRADRAYQTAAAHFYAMEYEQAATEFRAIAADSRSVWRPFGRYLAGRATIRFATIPTSSPDRQRLAAAEADLRDVLADAAAAPLHPSARGLLGFLSARIHPIERLHELSKRLTARQPPDDQDFNDYRFILDAISVPTAPFPRSEMVRNDDLTDWLLAMRDEDDDAAGVRALEQWRANNTPHWLVAALWHVRGPGPDANALLGAARLLPRQSPAFPTVAFLRIRLLTAVGRQRDARSLLASLPRRPAPGFNAETVNLFNAERLMLAENLDQFLANAPRTVVVEWTDPPRIPGGPRVLKAPNHDQPVLDEDAATTLAEHLPLTRLVDAALSPQLPRRLRLRVALAAFTRAIVLKRDEAGASLIPTLRDLASALGADLDRYARAATAADRYNAGVLLLLNTPGATVDVRGSEDDYWFGVTDPAREFDHLFRRNWWCESNGRFHATSISAAVHLLYPGDVVAAPVFVTTAERDIAARERRAILAEGPPRHFLGRAAIRLAAQHPEEPAMAEALARVVDGWRWTCGADEGSATPLPQQAFALLHRLFPKSDAAQRTKYWYRD